MVTTALRPVFAITGATVLAVVASGLAVTGIVHARDVRQARRMAAIARNVQDPPGLVALPRGACPSQDALVSCMIGTQTPDTLTAIYRQALTRAAGQAATSSCVTLPHGPGSRSCLVRIDSGDHAVLISIDSNYARSGTALAAAGSRVRIDAS